MAADRIRHVEKENNQNNGNASNESDKIQELEKSLINFLLRKRDIEERVTGGSRRVKALILKINEKSSIFSVQIGMMEAKFSINTGLKEYGSCYGLDRYVRDWYLQPSIRDELKKMGINQVKKDK